MTKMVMFTFYGLIMAYIAPLEALTVHDFFSLTISYIWVLAYASKE